ncbi:WD-repeat protein [Rivularia sp. IAM M-261]|nr:WD-repeat protein [Rivularia sp. IAM M-261]
MAVSINLEFGDGDFEHGFEQSQFVVTVTTLNSQSTQIVSQLSPSPEIPKLYEYWKRQYHSLLQINGQRGFKNNQPTYVSSEDCYEQAMALWRQLHKWLEPVNLELEPILQQYRNEEIHLVIHTEKVTSLTAKDILHRLPWQEWNLCSQNSSSYNSTTKNYIGEAALCFKSNHGNIIVGSNSDKIRRVKIISIFGDSEGIDTNCDQELLLKLKKRGTEVIRLTEPTRADFEKLWDEPCDILFFAGHSETTSDGTGGVIKINRHDSLSLADIKKTLGAAIEKGLKLAIFNSCDGLGLARDLADLNLSYIIVWREVVPDLIAQKFIRYFLSSYVNGKSLFASVREARYKLSELASQNLEKQLPGITWLPIICQNTNEPPPFWSDLGGLTGELPDNPYKGLAAFRESDAKFYFGRDKFVADLLDAVYNMPLVPIVGASGSGKSSLVFAGLVPKLRSARDVKIVSFRPENKPFDNLAVALSKLDLDNAGAQIGLDSNWRHDETKLCDYIQTIILTSGYERLVLIADQFEELFTLTEETERRSFLKALYFAIKYTSNFTLVLTLRADFLGIVLNSSLGNALQEYAPKLLAPMNNEELRSAIEKPAARMKVELSPGLTNKLIADLGNHPGRLPLLEFALTQLWEKQEDWYLTHQAYEEIGGLEKALALYADEVLRDLSKEEKQQAERIFIQLVRPGEGTQDTKSVATRNEIGKKNWGLVKLLADKRLVVTGWDATKKIKTVEIVHEALIQEWKTLREWIETNREFRVWQERLKPEIRDWENSAQNPESLLQKTRLAVAEDWYKQRRDEITPHARRFITASIKWHKRQQQKQKRKRQLTILALTGVLIVALMLAGNAWWQWQNSAKSEVTAISQSSTAVFASNQKLDALREAIRAKRKLLSLAFVDSDIKNNVELTLRQAVYGAVEYNNLEGHKGEVRSVAFSPDGEMFASTSHDRTVKLWKRDGTLLKTLGGYEAGVADVAFSPDGQIIASASEDKTVKVWSKDGALLGTLQNHTGSVWGVAISPDGQTLASASDDNTIVLWEIVPKSAPVYLRTLKGHAGAVNAVAFSPDSNTLVSGGSDKTVRLWKRDGTLLKTFVGHGDAVWDVAYSPDGNTIVSGSGDSTVNIWNQEGKVLKTLKGHQASIAGVAISSDGNTIASASWDNTVKLWNFDGALLTTLNGHSNRVWKVAFSPKSKILASASGDETIKFWKLDSKLLTTFRGHSAAIIGAAISPDGKMIASASDDKTVKLWTQDSALPVTLRHKEAVYRVAFSPDNSKIVSVGLDATVRLWSKNGDLLSTFAKSNSDPIWAVAISPDGRTIASAGKDRAIRLWDQNGALLKMFNNAHDDSIWDIAISSDGNTIVSASTDKTVKLRKLDGTLLKTFKHETGVWTVAISPDGNTIASAGEDRTVKVWKKDGALLHNLEGHSSIVFGVAISPDGKTLASASGDKTIKLWDIRTGVLLATLNGHSSRVWRVAFSHDNKYLVSAGDDKTVILWNLDRAIELNKVLGYGCDWIQDYLKTNPNVTNRNLCNGIKSE